MSKRVTVRRGGKTYRYEYTSDLADPRIGKTTSDGYQVKYTKAPYVTKRGGKSPTLISKSGKGYNTRIQALLSVTTDRTTRNEILAELENWKKYKKGRRMTLKTLTAILEDNRYAKMFVNVGMTPEQAARELGVSLEELLDARNWKKNTFSLGGKKLAKFLFKYTGSIWERQQEQ